MTDLRPARAAPGGIAADEAAGLSGWARHYIERTWALWDDPAQAIRRWARSPADIEEMTAQRELLTRLRGLADAPGQEPITCGPLFGALVDAFDFDLTLGRIAAFAEFLLLYRRMLPDTAERVLAAAFAAATALPRRSPEQRTDLLRSLEGSFQLRRRESGQAPPAKPRMEKSPA